MTSLRQMTQETIDRLYRKSVDFVLDKCCSFSRTDDNLTEIEKIQRIIANANKVIEQYKAKLKSFEHFTLFAEDVKQDEEMVLNRFIVFSAEKLLEDYSEDCIELQQKLKDENNFEENYNKQRGIKND